MGTAQMCGCVIVGAISLAIAAGFTVVKKCLVRRIIDTDPDFAYNRVNTIDVAAQFVFAMKALGVVSTQATVVTDVPFIRLQ